MSAQHTPGPWETRRARTPDNTGGYDWAVAKDGKVIAECFEHVDFADVGTGFYRVPVEANARLIAAAPDLLEALVEWQGILADGIMNCHHERLEDASNAMGAAIAKATAA